MRRLALRGAAFACALLLFGPALLAAEIHVVSSGGFAAALKVLAPEFERQSGNTLVLDWGPSMGDTRDAVPQRIARGERIDVVIMVAYALDKLVEQGTIGRDERVTVARSGIGGAVKQGAPAPDISTVDGLRRALLAAHSIAYSDSASGVYIQDQLFRKLGIEEQVRGKARMIPATPVGQIVAEGEADLGFQQVSELRPVSGITVLGSLPPEVQDWTLYSAGVLANSTVKAQASALLAFLASTRAAPVISATGMEPIPRS